MAMFLCNFGPGLFATGYRIERVRFKDGDKEVNILVDCPFLATDDGVG